MPNKKPKNFLTKIKAFFTHTFKSQEPSTPEPIIPENLPESIEEIQKTVEHLSAQIRELSRENKKLSSALADSLRIRRLLLVITIISILSNIILIFSISFKR